MKKTVSPNSMSIVYKRTIPFMDIKTIINLYMTNNDVRQLMNDPSFLREIYVSKGLKPSSIKLNFKKFLGDIEKANPTQFCTSVLPIQECLIYAAMADNKRLVLTLAKKLDYNNQILIIDAAAQGTKSVISFLYNKLTWIDNYKRPILAKTSYCGNIPVLEWMINHKSNFSTKEIILSLMLFASNNTIEHFSNYIVPEYLKYTRKRAFKDYIRYYDIPLKVTFVYASLLYEITVRFPHDITIEDLLHVIDTSRIPSERAMLRKELILISKHK